jgi:hypothetical protein
LTGSGGIRYRQRRRTQQLGGRPISRQTMSDRAGRFRALAFMPLSAAFAATIPTRSRSQ